MLFYDLFKFIEVLLQTQISSNFKEDTEESVGSLDDYKAYKGITD